MALVRTKPPAAPPIVAAPLPASKPAEPQEPAKTSPMEVASTDSAARSNPGPEPSTAEKEAKPGTRTDLPPGSVGMAAKTDGVLLRFDPSLNEWTQLRESTPLRSQDRLLSLDPFRSTLDVGGTGASIDLVGETEIWLILPPPNQAARFQMSRGRVVLHGGSPLQTFDVQLAGKSVMITPATGSAVGIERVNRFEPGQPESSSSLLRIYGSEGEVNLDVDNNKQILKGPGTINWDGSRWVDRMEKPPPAWVTESKPSPFEQQIGSQFVSYFRPNRPINSVLVEALEDDQKDIRRLAIRGLRHCG